MPAPDKEIVMGEALLVMVMLPLAIAAVAGVKMTLKEAVCPVGMIDPDETPVALKPGPEMMTLEILTADSPKLFRATVRVLLLPLVTVPRFRFEVLGLKLLRLKLLEP